MGFTKLDGNIIFSSIMGEDDSVFRVWIIILATCKRDGVSPATTIFISNITRKPLEEIERCIKVLESPDKNSRTPNNEGRRIKRVDGGFFVFNYEKYREPDVSEYERERKRKQREINEKRAIVRDIPGNVPDPSASASSSSSASSLSSFQEGCGGNKNTIPPTLEMVTAYCIERNNRIDPQEFIDSYTAKGWMIGKNKMKDWQASIRTWEKNGYFKPGTAGDGRNSSGQSNVRRGTQDGGGTGTKYPDSN
jgi:hypothetical protein